MNWKKGCLALALLATSVQCKQDSASSPSATAGITSPLIYFTGTYELVSFSRTTEFGQELDENDFDSISGSLVMTPIVERQVVTIDGEETIIEGTYGHSPDGFGANTGTIDFFVNDTNNEDDLSGEYSIFGKELVISLNGTSDLGVDYTETIVWKKLSDFPE